MTNAVKIIDENKYEDGAYTALMSVYGMEFAVSLGSKGGEIKVFGTGGQNKRKQWQISGAAKLVKQTAISSIGG